jgi:hypothetical protein
MMQYNTLSRYSIFYLETLSDGTSVEVGGCMRGKGTRGGTDNYAAHIEN